MIACQLLIFLYSWWCTVHKYTVRHPCSSSPSSRSTGGRRGPRSSHPGPADSLRGKKSCQRARSGRPTADCRLDMSKISFYPRSTCWSAGSRGCCCRTGVRTDHGLLGADPWQGPAGQPIGLAEIRCAFLYDMGWSFKHRLLASGLSRRPQLRSIWTHSVRFLSLVLYGHCGHSLPNAFFQHVFSWVQFYILYRTEGALELNRRSYFLDSETDTGDVSTIPWLYEYHLMTACVYVSIIKRKRLLIHWHTNRHTKAKKSAWVKGNFAPSKKS